MLFDIARHTPPLPQPHRLGSCPREPVPSTPWHGPTDSPCRHHPPPWGRSKARLCSCTASPVATQVRAHTTQSSSSCRTRPHIQEGVSPPKLFNSCFLLTLFPNPGSPAATSRCKGRYSSRGEIRHGRPRAAPGRGAGSASARLQGQGEPGPPRCHDGTPWARHLQWEKQQSQPNPWMGSSWVGSEEGTPGRLARAPWGPAGKMHTQLLELE